MKSIYLTNSSFYLGNDVAGVARSLLGKVLLTRSSGKVTSGIIVETEAYSYREKGCHAYNGRITARNEVMFKQGGHAYVYLCYGIHHLFNVVTNVEGKADAVLIRALEPIEGVELMKHRMKVKAETRLTSGPGKLTRALAIDRSLNGASLVKNKVWLEDQGQQIRLSEILSTARIGIDYAGPDAFLPWRFTLKDNPWISK